MQYSLEKAIKRTGLPLIVTSSKPHLCFIIDTGATQNIVFSFVYDALPQYFKSTKDTSCLMGIEGTSNKVKRVEATIAFEDNKAASVFSVLDATNAVYQIQNENGIQIHGILGIPFLVQNKWILDFNNLSVQC